MADKPILSYGIEVLAAVGGREIGIVVGETHGATVAWYKGHEARSKPIKSGTFREYY